MSPILIFLSLLPLALADTDSECLSLTAENCSLFGRQKVENRLHMFCFYCHNFCGFSSLILYVFLFMGRKDRIHKIVGRILGIPLLGAMISGVTLINFPQKSETSLISSFTSGRLAFTVQGYCLITIILNGFIFQRWIKSPRFGVILMIMHCFNLYKGVQCLKFLISYCLGNISGAIDAMREASLELILLVSVPAAFIDLSYLWIHWNHQKNGYRNFDWRKHHNMSVVFLCFMTMIGVCFNIAHDDYWFFSQRIENLGIRLLVLESPLGCFVWWNWKAIKGPIFQHIYSEQEKEQNFSVGKTKMENESGNEKPHRN